MTKKKFFSTLSSALVVVSLLIAPCINVLANEENSNDVYTVTLKAGEGSGSDIIVKSSDLNAIVTGDSEAITKGKFGYSDDSMVYCLPDMPNTFSAPTSNSNGTFLGWQPTDDNNVYKPSFLWYLDNNDTRSITFNAIWGDSYYTLHSPDVVDILNSGVTNITSQLTNLNLGTFYDHNQHTVDAEFIYFHYFDGILTSGNKSIPYTVRSTFEPVSTEDDSVPLLKAKSQSNVSDTSSAITQPFKSAGGNVRMEIYISPEDYQNASPGTYTGNLKYTGIYAYKWYENVVKKSSFNPYLEETDGPSGFIPLRLTIPAKTYTVTLPDSNPSYTISYNEYTTVNAGSDFTFVVKISEGYQKGENFEIRSNGIKLDELDGAYTIKNIQENQLVTIEGVEKIFNDSNPQFLQTGDSSLLIPIISIATISALGLTMFIIREKKHKTM